MNNHPNHSVFNRKPWLKILIIAIITLTVICGLLWVNAVWGNPIRKQMAKSRCLDYFQDQYHDLYIVHEIEYSSKLPGYVLTLSPEKDPQIQFTCNPNCDTLCYSDEYGGKLASLILVEHIKTILGPSYEHLALQISATEDPNTEFGGENPDYFETDPHIRLTKNHQNLSISWVDPYINRENFKRIAEDIAVLIETQLPVINPNLNINITIYLNSSRQVGQFTANTIHFPTANFEE
jgi:hypothetical protein